MNTYKISGKVTDSDEKAVAQAEVRFVSGLATLGATPSAVIVSTEPIEWTSEVTGFTGDRWAAYAKYVAQSVAGLSYAEFKPQVVVKNPQLFASGFRFQDYLSYLLPVSPARNDGVVWDRVLAQFHGTRWDCWQQYVAGKVVGLDWPSFREAVANENPWLVQDGYTFRSEKEYKLPRTLGLDEFAVVTTTSSTGRYVVDALPAGDYRVEVILDGELVDTSHLTVAGDRPYDISISTIFPLIAAAAAPAGFVKRSGTRFLLNGQPFGRFVGFNMQALVHYGKGDIGEMAFSVPQHQQAQLAAARQIGARVVRVFLPVKNRSAQEVGDRLEALFSLIHSDFKGIYLIVALTNLYNNFGQFPQGDEKFFENIFNILQRPFFDRGYETNYLPFVRDIVTRFKGEPNIFAWEPGNELMCAQDPGLFVRFMKDITARIKELDPNHMVTTGMKSTQHSDMLIASNQHLRKELYGSPQIDFVTVHSYTRNKHAPNRPDDEDVFKDIELAQAFGKPLLVEEAGIVRLPRDNSNGEACDDGADRSDMLKDHLKRWFDIPETCGFLQWGFTVDRNTGDGDGCSGLVNGLHSDFQSMISVYSHFAIDLAN